MFKFDKNFTMAGDIIFINNMMPLFVTISRNLRFATVDNIQYSPDKTILKSIGGFNSLYSNNGFKVTNMLMGW